MAVALAVAVAVHGRSAAEANLEKQKKSWGVGWDLKKWQHMVQVLIYVDSTTKS